jgi:predicted RND superfamily exporter protein
MTSMPQCDPREWSIRHPWTVVAVFTTLSVMFVWGNLRMQKGGILDRDVILREDDPFRLMDQYVQDKIREGFEGREFIPLVINRDIRSGEDAEKILRLTRAAQAAFGKTVLSLATAPAYHDIGEALLDEPYVTKTTIAPENFHIEDWRRNVAADPGVFGLLVGRDFSWSSVVRYLPPGYDEIKEFRRTVEFVEGREIPWWEWLWKKDISPRESWLGVSGWTVGRGLIDQGLNVDILTLIFLGVGLTLPIFWAVLGSGRAALLSVGVMVVGGFVWTRGAMGLLGIPERVFSLLAYASVIVQGTSFALHKFSAWEEGRVTDRPAGWLLARSVDGVIATTAVVSAFGFATLWSFGLKPIRELGVSAMFGVLCLLFLAVFVLPAVDILATSQAKPTSCPSGAAPTRCRFFHEWLEIFSLVIDRVVAGCQHVVAWLTVGYRPWVVVGGICGLFACIALIFVRGEIASYTRALEFIRGTLVERQAQVFNQPGNVGFEFFDLLVEPAQGKGTSDPRFLARAWEFQEKLKMIPGSRETSSILGTLRQIARESFKKSLPDTFEEVSAAFFLIENRLAPAVQRQLYFPGGVRISVSYGTDDSVALGRFRDDVLALAQQSFPDLKITAFNKVPLYPQVDKYVREGKVYNVFASQIGIALLCGVILWRQNRRLRDVRLAPLWGGLVMSLPLFFATVVLGLLMWFFHIPLDMATAPIGALAINAATDFSLYLALTYQRTLGEGAPMEALHKTLRIEGKVILADCLLNTCCFLPLISSHFLPVRQLGWMMGVMLIACALGTLLFMAALLPLCVTRKEHRYDHEIAPASVGGGCPVPLVSRARGAHGAGSHTTRAEAA